MRSFSPPARRLSSNAWLSIQTAPGMRPLLLARPRAHVDDQRRLVAGEQIVQLVDAHARHAQRADQLVALQRLDGDEQRQRDDQRDESPATRLGEDREDVVDRVAEYPTQRHRDPAPEQCADRVEQREAPEPGSHHPGHAGRDGGESRDELGDDERWRAPALVDGLGLAHATVGRQRELAHQAQHPTAVPGTGEVPGEVGDQAGHRRDRDHLRDGDLRRAQ